jgi:hypothetical protein
MTFTINLRLRLGRSRGPDRRPGGPRLVRAGAACGPARAGRVGGAREWHLNWEQVDLAAAHQRQRGGAQDGGDGIGCPTKATVPLGPPVLTRTAGHTVQHSGGLCGKWRRSHATAGQNCAPVLRRMQCRTWLCPVCLPAERAGQLHPVQRFVGRRPEDQRCHIGLPAALATGGC